MSADKVAVMTVSLDEKRTKLARHAAALNARHARRRALPALVLFTDDTRTPDWAEAVRALPMGRAAVVVRHRDAAARAALVAALMPICRGRRVLLLVADDVALAQRSGADGVHLPEARMGCIADVRRRKARWLVSTAAHNVRAVRRARRLGVDAVFVSPAFATASHPERAALGAVRLALLAQEVDGCYALGGIETKTIRRLIAHRIVGIGLIGGWLRS